VSSGGLPPGLTLAADTGRLSGTPTSAGTFFFSIAVADAGGTPETVQSPLLSITILPASLPAGAFGQTIP
jgi:hypothetical protein